MTFFQKAFFCLGLMILTIIGITVIRGIFNEAMGKGDIRRARARQ
jgi:hypothetical protein